MPEQTPEFTPEKAPIKPQKAPKKPKAQKPAATDTGKNPSWTTMATFPDHAQAKAFIAQHFGSATKPGGGGMVEVKIKRGNDGYRVKARRLDGKALPTIKAGK